MATGAGTPEELDALLEDAFVVRDDGAVAALFESEAVVVDTAGRETRGAPEIASWARQSWLRGRTYVAADHQVLQAGDTALVLTAHGIAVARRRTDRAWRYAIALLASEHRQNQGGTMTTQTTPTLAAHVVPAKGGEAIWWFGALAEIKATAADTGGLMTILEMTEPPHSEAPLHVHHREDEAFWILEGEVTITVGDTTVECRAGDYAFGPRGVPHRFTVGENGCRMLFILTPGGFEGLVREMGEPARTRTLPPPGEPDMERVAAIARAYGCELLA